jgi:hypothetical protein
LCENTPTQKKKTPLFAFSLTAKKPRKKKRKREDPGKRSETDKKLFTFNFYLFFTSESIRSPSAKKNPFTSSRKNYYSSPFPFILKSFKNLTKNKGRPRILKKILTSCIFPKIST